MRRLQPDLVVLHGQWAGPLGAIALQVAGLHHSIYVAHWPSFYTDWTILRVVRNHLCERIPCQIASRVVTLSAGNYYQYCLRRLAPMNRLVIIHNFIDPALLPPAAAVANLRQRQGWSTREYHVVSLSRLSDQKCLHWLLRSWLLVIAQIPSAHLWIVGDGPEREMLEHLARHLGINSACSFVGSQPEALDYIAAADVVAMTTMYEGHARVPLEALACGKPIVASKVDGVTDTIRDGLDGFLVPPGDETGFAEKIVLLLRSAELREQMGRNDRARG